MKHPKKFKLKITATMLLMAILKVAISHDIGYLYIDNSTTTNVTTNIRIG